MFRPAALNDSSGLALNREKPREHQMRDKVLAAVAAAFALSSVGLAPVVANAYPSPAQMHKDGEIKDPVKADAAISKDMAKDARKKAHRAHHYARIAAHKAKKVEKDARETG